MPLRLVTDASSLVRAALGPGSAAGRLLAAAYEGRAELLGSTETLEEVARVLSRPKFAARLPERVREGFITTLTGVTRLIELAAPVTECRDPDDDKYLALALAGGASIVVSDDHDLLALDPWRGVRIVKPEAALALLPGRG